MPIIADIPPIAARAALQWLFTVFTKGWRSAPYCAQVPASLMCSGGRVDKRSALWANDCVIESCYLKYFCIVLRSVSFA
ncbi:unnamed protein product [Cylicocyclus nassatus]|uniref:Uncharacterized protein n=1 Tax=Cylicocyclus nassatus TaxID=53992 RepID=A0AA36DTP0_CYLNA|nr:unnamed protein product [Cylicocyclus nassatus]